MVVVVRCPLMGQIKANKHWSVIRRRRRWRKPAPVCSLMNDRRLLLQQHKLQQSAVLQRNLHTHTDKSHKVVL